MRAFYIMRKDLKMTAAKLAVQVGHGTVYIADDVDKKLWNKWIKEDAMRKIVLEVSSEEKLKNIYGRFISEDWERGLVCQEIWDNGYTEFDGITLTGIVIFCEETPKYIKRLRLYTED